MTLYVSEIIRAESYSLISLLDSITFNHGTSWILSYDVSGTPRLSYVWLGLGSNHMLVSEVKKLFEIS